MKGQVIKMCNDRFNDSEKEIIYEQFTNYQIKNNLYPPEYSYKAYSDSTYRLWLTVITKDAKI